MQPKRQRMGEDHAKKPDPVKQQAHSKHEIKHELTEKKQELKEKASQEVSFGGRKVEKSAIIKLAGLIAFFLILAFVVYLIMPYIKDLFQPGGIDRVMSEVRNAGVLGVFILLGLQFLQIVVAFIPGEITQVAAGMLYGPWLGTLIILVGCVISSAFIFVLVNKLGAPFVQSMVSPKFMDRFREFEKGNKLKVIVFILFLIPGLPKDVFTYLVPLTDMRMRDFLVLATVGRIPGVFVSTYAADGLMEGRVIESAIIFGIGAAIAIAGILNRDKIMDLVGRIRKKSEDMQD